MMPASRPARTTAASDKRPDGVEVLPPTPTPFDGPTAFRVDLPRAGAVTVEVFDVLGRRVAVAFEGRLAAGAHRLPFDGAALSPGVYLFRVTTEAGAVGGTMVRR